jgi:diaminohydroxyphosphoribosylaminopyrimidine deaminase/5-amino-6-(5-phosphoribosylamino)uracil reductase
MSIPRPEHERFMRRALRLAAQGRGCVEPNPLVGAVLVRGGRILGAGYHRAFGGPHAEVEALERCGGAARGATLYVTLEPCCHHGKTPPCTDALIAAGLRRVVAAMLDPNPRVAGRGAARLRAAGLAVEIGPLAGEAAALNAPFIKLMRQGRPWVILKWAQSLDGKIATRTGDSRWISDERMRAHAHRVRGRVDAILVGRRTVARDDPQLTGRIGRVRRVATRIVLDSHLRTPPEATLVQTARAVPTWICCRPDAPRRRAARLEAAGCVIQPLPPSGEDETAGVSLPALLDLLGADEMTNVLVEGGGAVLGAFCDQRLADELHVYIAPKVIGGAAAVSAVAGVGAAAVPEALLPAGPPRLRRLGTGWFLQARLAAPRV